MENAEPLEICQVPLVCVCESERRETEREGEDRGCGSEWSYSTCVYTHVLDHSHHKPYQPTIFPLSNPISGAQVSGSLLVADATVIISGLATWT